MELINKVISNIGNLDHSLMEKTQKRLDNLTKPLGSLGRLEELAKHIVGITRNENPLLQHKVIITMAGDHGVTEEKVSAYPKEVTPQMVYNFLRGGAGINVLAKQIGARVVVVDMGVAGELKVEGLKFEDKGLGFKNCKINLGTKNFTKGPAMSRAEAIKSIEAGIKIVQEESSGQPCKATGEAGGIDIIGTGDMGIGNTTPSTAIIAVLTGQSVEQVVGRGTGIDDATLESKIATIKKGIALNKPDPADAIDVLSKVGGFEIGGLTGVILAAASQQIPVVIDGFISGAAALLATRLVPKVKDYLIASHCSQEQGHRGLLESMGLEPLLDLRLRLGEGTGAALAMHLAESAIRILKEMASFDSAGVSKKTDN